MEEMEELVGTIVTREQRQLAALEQTYPAWRITFRDSAVGWWATRFAPLTPGQAAAGLVPSVARSTAEGLAAALSVQDEIAGLIKGRGTFVRQVAEDGQS